MADKVRMAGFGMLPSNAGPGDVACHLVQFESDRQTLRSGHVPIPRNLDFQGRRGVHAR